MHDSMEKKDFDKGFFGGHFHGSFLVLNPTQTAVELDLIWRRDQWHDGFEASNKYLNFIIFLCFIFPVFAYSSGHERPVWRIETARFCLRPSPGLHAPRPSRSWRPALACRSQPCIAGWPRLETAGLLQRTPRRPEDFELAPRSSPAGVFNPRPTGRAGTVRREILQRAVQEVGEACNLTVLDGNPTFTYLDRVGGGVAALGFRISTGIKGAGLLLRQRQAVSGLDAAGQTRSACSVSNFAGAPDGQYDNEKTDLIKELAEIRRNGYALDREEFLSGLVFCCPHLSAKRPVRAHVSPRSPFRRRSRGCPPRIS